MISNVCCHVNCVVQQCFFQILQQYDQLVIMVDRTKKEIIVIVMLVVILVLKFIIQLKFPVHTSIPYSVTKVCEVKNDVSSCLTAPPSVSFNTAVDISPP